MVGLECKEVLILMELKVSPRLLFLTPLKLKREMNNTKNCNFILMNKQLLLVDQFNINLMEMMKMLIFLQNQPFE